MEKIKTLFILKIPPPVTGATMMNEIIYNSKKIRNYFNSFYLPVSYKKKIDTNILSFNRLVIFFSVVKRLINNLIFVKPNLIYFQISPLGVAFLRDFIILLIAKIFKVPVLIHLRVYGIKNAINKSFIWKSLYTFAFKNNYIACHSEILAQDFKEIFSGKYFIINNGIPDKFGTINHFDRSDNEHIRILFLSNFLKSKGVKDTFQIAENLIGKKINFQLFLVGNFTKYYTEKKLKKFIAKKKLNNYVQLIGPVADKEKHAYLRKSDIFIFPTHYEAFGNVAIEAMQASLPVISYKEGSLPIIISDKINGFLIDKGNIHDFTNKIQKLAKNPDLRKRMGYRGRKKYLELYTIEKFENNLKSILKEISVTV